MKINQQQFDALNAKLIWIQEQMAQSNREYLKRKTLNDERWERLERDVNVLKGVGQELLTGQGVLCERLDALANVIVAHDLWAKEYNVTVEARNKRVSELGEEWQNTQRQSVEAFAKLFEGLLEKLDAIHAALPKPGAKRRRK